MANNADPLAFFECLDDVGGYCNASDLLDLAARYWLAIGNQCQGLKQGARVAAWALSPEPGNPAMNFIAHLVAKS